LSAYPAPDCSALALAEQFHDTYERLAPTFGYETRPETREFNPESPNGRLMVAVCKEIIEQNNVLTVSGGPGETP
jgi:hypothetical protein